MIAAIVTETFVQGGVRPHGIAELVRRSAVRDPDATALFYEGRRWSYRELWAALGGTAGELVALGVDPGDRVAVLGRNSDRYVITFLATQLLGALHVPINFMLS